jgi:hypothetical protein
MVYVLKTVWTRVTFDLKDWEKEVAEAKRNEIWKQLGYESIDDVLEKEVGYSKVELAEKCAAARDNPLPDVGPPTKEERANPTNSRISTYGGNTDYTLRRLARDKQNELLDRTVNVDNINIVNSQVQLVVIGAARMPPVGAAMAIFQAQRDSRSMRLYWVLESLAEPSRG